MIIFFVQRKSNILPAQRIHGLISAGVTKREKKHTFQVWSVLVTLEPPKLSGIISGLPGPTNANGGMFRRPAQLLLTAENEHIEGSMHVR